MSINLSKQSLGDSIANDIRRRIWSNELKPGERLIESELSSEYEVSRNAIRDALNILESEKIIQRNPRRGSYVYPFTDKDWKEILELRKMLESYSLKSLNEITEEEINALEKNLNEIKTIASEENKANWEKLFELDLKFHKQLVCLSNNSRIIDIYKSIQTQIRTFWFNLENYYSSQMSFYNEHEELLNILLTKDIDRSTEALLTHIEYVEGKYFFRKNE